MTNSELPVLDDFWSEFFRHKIAAGEPRERILASVTTLNLQRAEQAIDLSLVAHMPNLREVLAPAATVPITHKEALRRCRPCARSCSHRARSPPLIFRFSSGARR